MTNLLYYGDNLDVLRRHIDSETVDLVYLDPPFNSNQNYNVLFAEHDGTRAAAQIKAFGDTWTWDESSARAYQEVVEGGGRVSEVLHAFRAYLDRTDMLAYLSMMAPRLVELRRVMKPTATIYLHCDPTASHYLKIIMDAVFGPAFFLNEITWQRTGSHGDAKRNFASVSDALLVYTKTSTYTFNPQFVAFEESYIEQKFRYRDDDGRRWQSVTLRSPNPRPNLFYPYTASNGVTYHPHPNGWSCNLERMQQYDAEHRLHFPPKADGQLRLKMYLDISPGVKLHNVWTDIPPLNSQAQERLGYPTQKPEALLERIIRASSNDGDLILDPFCGCGTSIAAAQRMGRKWVGIDITHLAIGLIKSRLRDAFGDTIANTYKVIGEPTTVADAEELAKDDPYQFQWWALGLVGARPTEQKKGADRGIDGRLYFHDEGLTGKTKQVILSVKAGKLHAPYVRDLGGVITRERADIGVLISMDEPTKLMRAEAANAGFYTSLYGTVHPRLQLLTITELLAGKGIDYPAPRQTNITTKRAPRSRKDEDHGKLF